jgi:large-conductance mechanosensitive channel
MHWLLPTIVINFGLIGLAVYLIVRGLRRLRHYDRLITDYKRKHVQLAKLLA